MHFLASAPSHFLMLGRCCLLAVGIGLITLYVSCPVLRALPAATKVDGWPRVLSRFVVENIVIALRLIYTRHLEKSF